MQPLKGPDAGYVFRPPRRSMPFPAGVQPTLLLGEKELVFATSLATARRARDLADRPGGRGLPPGDPLAEALDQLPDRLIFLAVSDTRQSMLPDVLVEPARTWSRIGQRISFELPGILFSDASASRSVCLDCAAALAAPWQRRTSPPPGEKPKVPSRPRRSTPS